MSSTQLHKKWNRIIGFGCVAFVVGILLIQTGRKANWSPEPSLRMATTSSASSPPNDKSIYLLKTNHIPNEGLASSINFMKDALILGQLLGREPVMAQNQALFDYHPSTLVNGDLEHASLPGPFCDFHTYVGTVRYDEVGKLEGKLQASEDKTHKLLDDFCRDDFTQHRAVQGLRHQTEHCRTLLYTTSKLYNMVGCWNRTRPLLTKRMGFDTSLPQTKISIHYRWGDRAAIMSAKWAMDSATVNKVVAKLKQMYGQDVPVELHMEAALHDVGGINAAAKRKEFNFAYKLMNDVDVLRDLQSYAGTRVLIGGGGTYTALIATFTQPELLITNGFNSANTRTAFIGTEGKLLSFDEFLSSPSVQKQA